MTTHWTSVTRSRLISFFHVLTSHIPPLASSCNGQTPKRTTASASHGGASPTQCPVADNSISIVIDVPPPINDGAIPTLSACGTRSPSTAGRSQARTFESSQPTPVHPIAKVFQTKEMGKAMLGFAIPMTTGLFFNQYQGLTHLQASAIAIALSIGFTTTWNGMLLRGICPRVARALEYFGVGTILAAFFGLVSSFVPPTLVWACWLCCGSSCLPLLLCLVPPAAADEESSTERLDEGIV